MSGYVLTINANTDQKLKKVRKESAEWCVALSGDNVDKDVLDAFNLWRLKDTLHQQVFQQTDRVWKGLEGLKNMDRSPLLKDTD